VLITRSKISASLWRVTATPKPTKLNKTSGLVPVNKPTLFHQQISGNNQLSSQILDTRSTGNCPCDKSLFNSIKINKSSKLNHLKSSNATKQSKKKSKYSTFLISHYFSNIAVPTIYKKHMSSPLQIEHNAPLADPLSPLLSPTSCSQTHTTRTIAAINPQQISPKVLFMNYLSFIDHLPASPWYPRHLPTVRTQHPFDTACHPDTLSLIKRICDMPPQSTVVSLTKNDQDNISVSEFRKLINPDTPINQQIINFFYNNSRHNSRQGS
jgi:hypothetical protein